MGRKANLAPLTDFQRELAADPGHLRYAANLARRCGHPEAESAAMWALVMAARGWRNTGGCSFKTYLYRAVVNQLHALRRRDRPLGYRRRPPGPSVTALDGEVPGGDCPVGWELEYEDEVLGRTASLSDCRREAVRLRQLDPRAATAAGLAGLLGVDEGTAKARLWLGRRALRNGGGR